MRTGSGGRVDRWWALLLMMFIGNLSIFLAQVEYFGAGLAPAKMAHLRESGTLFIRRPSRDIDFSGARVESSAGRESSGV